MLACCLGALAPAAGGAAGVVGDSGLPLPRFASIGADKANLRAGPGLRYPIAWVFVRAGLPVLIVQEFEHWRKIRDRDGAEGWVHQSLLSGRRTAVVTGAVRTLRRAPEAGAPAVLRAEPGVIGRLAACRPDWCRLEVAERDGWLPKAELFGALAEEVFE